MVQVFKVRNEEASDARRSMVTKSPRLRASEGVSHVPPTHGTLGKAR